MDQTLGNATDDAPMEPEPGGHRDPEHQPADPTRILVGVDGSESSINALRHAARLASALGSPLEAIAVWQYPTSMYDAYYPAEGWHPDDDAKKLLGDAIEQVFPGERPAWFSATTERGSAARVLIEESHNAEMLVMGSRGHGGFVGLLLGSVSAACVRHAHCPVLIVRQPGEAERSE